MSDTIYVIGHTSPDTDAIMSAIIAADFLNKRDNTDKYSPVIPAEVNSETAFVAEQFNTTLPPVLNDATGKKLFLVDHNEQSQIVGGGTEIVGIIDHHRIKFESAAALDIVVKPWGCTCTLLYDLYEKEQITIPQELKGPMLCAILSDTVILKSPTTTPKDVEVVETLAKDLGVDYKELGMNMFKAKAQVANKSATEIIENDFKDFEIGAKKIAICQVETPDLAELEPKIPELIAELKSLKESGAYHSIILMLTDIIQEGSELLLVSDEEDKIASLLETTVTNNKSTFIPGMMSRKKQVAPVLTDNLE